MRLDVEITAAELPQNEFAALLQVSAPAVTKWKQKKRLVMSEDGKRVRVAESIARIRAGRDPARGGDRAAFRPAVPAAVHAHAATAARQEPPTAREAFGPQPAIGLVYQDEAAREKRAAAQLRELELAERVGQLLLAADVEHRVFGMARAGREAIMAIPDRISTILAAETDPAVVHAKLTAECRKVCELLAAPHPAASDEAKAA